MGAPPGTVSDIRCLVRCWLNPVVRNYSMAKCRSSASRYVGRVCALLLLNRPRGIVPRGMFLPRCPAACSLFRSDICSIGSPPSEFHPISPPVASGSVALNCYPIMPVSGTVTFWRIASVPCGVLATNHRLSLEGYLFQMDLFPYRESEGVSAQNGRIRGTFWFPGSASTFGVCRMYWIDRLSSK
jgi:hypothetical protein